MYLSRNVRKRTFRHVRPTKIQISLHIRAVWSDSSLDAILIAMDAKFLNEDNEDSDQTAWIHRLILSLRYAHVTRYVFWRFVSFNLSKEMTNWNQFNDTIILVVHYCIQNILT